MTLYMVMWMTSDLKHFRLSTDKQFICHHLSADYNNAQILLNHTAAPAYILQLQL